MSARKPSSEHVDDPVLPRNFGVIDFSKRRPSVFDGMPQLTEEDLIGFSQNAIDELTKEVRGK